MKFWGEKGESSYPWKSLDTWFVTENIRWGVIGQGVNKQALVNKVNRADIWRAAAKSIGQSGPAGDSRGPERFFDGKVFDPADPKAYRDGAVRFVPPAKRWRATPARTNVQPSDFGVYAEKP